MRILTLTLDDEYTIHGSHRSVSKPEFCDSCQISAVTNYGDVCARCTTNNINGRRKVQDGNFFTVGKSLSFLFALLTVLVLLQAFR